jgi:hypothetical protein
MKNTNTARLVLVSALLWLPSCNIYSPLASPKTDAEYVEEGRKCLQTSDYNCAITQYNLISDATLKAQQLCLVNISKTGLNLSTLVDVLSSSSAGSETMILVANKLLEKGYTTDRLAAGGDSVTACSGLGTDDTSILLKVLSRVADCGIRLARSNYEQATDDTTTATCNATVAGSRTGTLTTTDIGGDGTGTLSVANPGMCYADVQLCVDDMSAASTLLSGPSFDSLKDNILALPTDLIGGGSGAATIRATRVGLKNTVH